MCIYFVAEVIVYLLILITARQSQRARNRALLFCCIMWALIAGLRAYTVGNDTEGYAGFFDGTGHGGVGYGTVDNPGESIEWGFIAVGRVLNLISTNATFFLLVHAFFVYLMIYYVYRKHTYSLWGFIFLQTIGSGWIFYHPIMRQALSVGFVLLSIGILQGLKTELKPGIAMLKNKRVLAALLLFIFAMTIHRSSVLLFPMLVVIYYFKMTKTMAYIAIGVSFVLAMAFVSFIGAHFEEVLALVATIDNDDVALLGDRYAGGFGDTGYSIIRNLTWVIWGCVTIYYTKQEETNNFFVKCFVLAVVMNLMFNFITMVSRLSVLFLTLGCAKAVPATIKTKKLAFAFYVLFAAYYLWRAYANLSDPSEGNINNNIPYYFFWEK